jgi:POT family proton-dependent oligopeptide transporter
VLLLTPILLALWSRRALASAPHPRCAAWLGALLVAVAYLILVFASAQSASSGADTSWLWLLAFLAVLTVGELFILPTGLALFGRLAPGALAATSIALWFSASFAGNLLAGALGTFWTQLGAPRFFVMLSVVAACSALLLRLVDTPLRRAFDNGS